MTDNAHSEELGESATIDIMAAVMVERFGARAAHVATEQLAAAHASGSDVADRWLSIVMPIEGRLTDTQTEAPPTIRQSNKGET